MFYNIIIAPVETIIDWAGKYDCLKEQGVDVVDFPYGAGVSSTSLKESHLRELRADEAQGGQPLPR